MDFLLLFVRAHGPNAAANCGHRVLARLAGAGLVQDWITTNWDGLAQKAGQPQAGLLELAGSWFDPSNPRLGRGCIPRPDLLQRAATAVQQADLALVLGEAVCLLLFTRTRKCRK